MKQNETPNATFDNDDMVSISRDFRKLIENKVCVCVCVFIKPSSWVLRLYTDRKHAAISNGGVITNEYLP